MQYLHPQVTDVSERTKLELGGLPEYANYHAQTDTFD